MPSDRPPFFGLLRRGSCLLPTWRGWLLTVLIVLPLIAVGVRRVQPFLAVTDAAPGGALVVEGWMPDYGLREVLASTHSAPCPALYVTGGPLERGEPLSDYNTYANLGAATLAKLGANTPAPQAVPAPDVIRDRTYASAVALRDWLHARGPMPSQLTLVSLGAHARRSRLLFQRAFGPGVKINVLAIENRDYDAHHWWRSSEGVRTVTGEFIAYLYARFVFNAS